MHDEWLVVGYCLMACWVVIPLIQIPLRRSARPAANSAALVLLFVPSGLYFAMGVLIDAEWHDLAGFEYWTYQIVTHPWGHFFAFWVPVFLFLGLWFAVGAVFRVWCAHNEAEHRLARFGWMEKFLLKFIPTALLVTAIPTLAMGQYVTLEEAVRTGDLAMAEKRLESNILGQTARSTIAVHMSNGHFTVSLVQLAAERNDKAMVDLLVRHGGNPRDAELR